MSSVKTYPLPPNDFNAHAAQPRELRRYGLPQRPDPATHPELADRWDKAFSRKLTHIVPEFRSLNELLPGIEPRGALGANITTYPHPFWSGCVVHTAPGQTFNWVQGEWSVPDVVPPVIGQGNWNSFAWIGIDGTADVTQIGTIQYVSRDATGKVSKGCYAVSEWWPFNWSAISNFPLSFGDTVIGLICMESPTDAYVNLVNLTQGYRAGFDITPPTNTVSVENQIEWIFERPGVTGGSPELPKFGEIFFDGALGGNGLNYVVDAGTDTVLNMVQNNVTVATTTIETPTLIKIAYTGT
jgi:Peptidase A4 family